MCTCGQYLIGETRIQNGQPECEACYRKRVGEMNDMDNPWLAVKIKAQVQWMGNPDVVYLPFNREADEHAILAETTEEAMELIIAHYRSKECLTYNVDMVSIELVNMKDEPVTLTDPEDQVKCEETDWWIFKELAYEQEMKHRPFDAETTKYFASYIFAQCYLGQVYSKDFGYYFCEGCQTWVCGQNPSNGWMSQVHTHDTGEVECNKCFEERILELGINDDFDNNVPGGFFNQKDIDAHGWELVTEGMMVASGHSGYRDPNDAISVIKGIIDSGKRCLVDYDSMAIGGLGGYVTIYQKDLETANVKP